MVAAKKISTKHLDNLWREAVKRVHGVRCEFCGADSDSTVIQVHHIYGRRNYGTRWLIDNGVVLCANHHTLSSAFSAHQTPLDFSNWIIEKRGENLLKCLKQTANKVIRVREIDHDKLKQHLQEAING